MKNRIAIINSIIKEIVGQALQSESYPSSFGLITITRVQAAKNLDTAKVFVTASHNQNDLLPYLTKHVYQIQQILNQKMRLKIVPKILFRIDTNIDYAAHIEGIIKDL